MEQNLQVRVYTVSEITKSIKSTLETTPELNNAWIKGEIYNLTLHSSGHIYFTLKDNNAVISAVFFKFANRKLTFKLEEGMSVLAFGKITVFEKRGSYQVNVSHVRLEGIGELQKRIDQLKKKLLSEGIFDIDHKKPMPFLPARLGIVTSPTGAAVRDIIKVASRRYPNLEIILAPSKVQGDDAAVTIVRGIEELNRPEWGIDLIIAGRGGGSFEDLMPFNEEIVIRAFYNSRVPIISAVGHQIDHPLSDDAADLAVPTPSAAAEVAVPLKKELYDEIKYYLTRADNALQSRVRELRTRINGVMSRRIFMDPYEIVNYRQMILTDCENRIISNMKNITSEKRSQFFMIPDIKVLANNNIKNKTHKYNILLQALNKLSPLGIMKRGYSIARDEKDKIIRRVKDTNIGDIINLQMYDGALVCSVNSKEKGENLGKEKAE